MATKQPAAPAAVAAQAPSPSVPKEDRKVEQMNPTRMSEAEFQRSIYVCTAHANTKPTDLLDPAYWAHVSAKLKPWDHLEVRADDATWYAEFIVLEAGRTWAKVHMLNCQSLTSADVAASQAASLTPYDVVYRGEHAKWSVVRKVDREVVHENEATQGGAIDWLNERLKAGL